MSDSNELPPGHPAGSDDVITAGEVLSGRGRGQGGVVSDADSPEPVHEASGPTGDDEK